MWAFAALTGKVLWQTKVKGIPVSPAVGDLDADGKPEIVVTTGQGIITALNGNGGEIDMQGRSLLRPVTSAGQPSARPAN